ncbi:MAG: DUF932 domain-containing protein [Proteobacteria bacterium]|nr:DUF932 domain-containing protein [Pseudomonadota bacterium]
MAHEIFGERFIGVRQPAWHQLGTVLPAGTGITASEALERAGITWQYVTTPVGYTTPDGAFVEAEDRVAVLREPTADDPQWRRLGIVGSGYTFLQNAELAAGVDTVMAATGWELETAGALAEGASVFMSLAAGGMSVKGDELQSYFLVSDGKAIGRALSVSFTPVRVVCQNTLLMADAATVNGAKVAHSAKVAEDYAMWLELVPMMAAQQAAAGEALDRMASVKITQPQAAAVFAAAFPEPAKSHRAKAADIVENVEAYARLESGARSWEKALESVMASRAAAMELYERFNAGAEQGGQMAAKTLEAVRETPYAALQATTELLDWRPARKEEAAAQSAVFGSRASAKRRAWSAAMALAQ